MALNNDYIQAERDRELYRRGLYRNGTMKPECKADLFELIRAKDREIAELKRNIEKVTEGE